MAATLGTLNPFRWRSYVYDEEMYRYYLRSRYYSPPWHKFLNADSTLGKPGQLFGHNVFTYCRNNPVNYSDPSGRIRMDDVPDYTAEIDNALDIAIQAFMSHSVGDGSSTSLRDIVNHRGDFVWFYRQVDHNGPWDIKEDEPWHQQFPDLSIPNGKFIFHGEKITRENLGNYMYGYLGTAMGISSDFLYFMGGYAAFTKGKELTSEVAIDALSQAIAADTPYYGDSKIDHYWITKGINAYHTRK